MLTKLKPTFYSVDFHTSSTSPWLTWIQIFCRQNRYWSELQASLIFLVRAFDIEHVAILPNCNITERESDLGLRLQTRNGQDLHPRRMVFWWLIMKDRWLLTEGKRNRSGELPVEIRFDKLLSQNRFVLHAFCTHYIYIYISLEYFFIILCKGYQSPCSRLV